MNVLDLFSGIGGFSLGLERAGMRTVAFCEVDPFCRRVLAKHWPSVPCYDDVRSLTAERLAADGIAADVICGGFPCQDISLAGSGEGIDGARSGLWSEYARIIGELRPRYVIVENVAALLGRGLDRVLRDLAALGYDAEWHCIPASAVGAPHRRDRLWLVAYPGCGVEPECGNTNAMHHRRSSAKGSASQAGRSSGDGRAEDLAYAHQPRLEKRQGQDASAARPICWPILERDERWEFEPDVGRVAHGVPARVDRLRSLGNSVVPQIPEIIGRAIMMTLTGGNSQ